MPSVFFQKTEEKKHGGPETIALQGFESCIFFINTFWYARLDSNQRPSESESDALSNCATGAYINIFFKQLI